MRNSIIISVEFDFKGQHFAPKTKLDLDKFMQGDQNLELCFFALADANGIGRYSYELDVMMSEQLLFSEPVGVVKHFFHQGQIDWQGFQQAWLQDFEFQKLEAIANNIFNVENLSEHPKLAIALQMAYEAGSAQGTLYTENNQGWI